MCGGRSSILHYGPLIETNYLYAPPPNGQRPECVAKQKQYPTPLNGLQTAAQPQTCDECTTSGRDIRGGPLKTLFHKMY